MSLWVVAAAEMTAATLDLLGEVSQHRVTTAFAGARGRLERRQIAEASRIDAQLRIRQTGALVGAQRAALAASGVAGGRTSRLLEANARLAASRQQEQADMTTVLRRVSSVLNQQQIKTQSKLRVIASAGDLLTSAVTSAQGAMGTPSG